jgi:ribosomal-protein-alanine N-acetyltransferase
MHPALPHIKLATDRLLIQNWEPILNTPPQRSCLEVELKRILTPNVVKHLPLAMQFSADMGSISKWVSDRAEEAQILCVHTLEMVTLVGLIVLAQESEEGPSSSIQLGYFFGEKFWGNGIATEAVTALVTVFTNIPGTRLIARVDRSNVASATVLENSGFNRSLQKSSSSRLFFEHVVVN